MPILIRFSLKNIVLCELWYGNTKPDFDLFQIHFIRDIKRLQDSGFYVKQKDGLEYHFFVKMEASLADLPARAASIKIKQFNGKFGCPVCYHPGCQLRQGSLVRIYPFQEERERAAKRTNEEFRVHAVAAEQTNSTFFGIKARSLVLDIMSIPDEISFDYMHLVVEREIKRKLTKHFLNKNGILLDENLNSVNLILKDMQYPHDFSKKVISISEKSIKNAKAGEL